MAHVRTQIRQAVRAALIAGGTSAGPRVYLGRLRPFEVDELPAITIQRGDEQSEAATIGGPIEELDRDYALRITLHVLAADESYEEEIDELAAQVETIIARDAFNAGGAQFIYPTGTTPSESDEGEYIVARDTIEFKARYVTSQLDPTQTR